jgi:hypothetical protein
MSPPEPRITSSTRKIAPALAELLVELRPGQRIEITQTVRVGSKSWLAKVTGVYRGVNYLATGLATDRVPEDDIVVPVVHFAKDIVGPASQDPAKKLSPELSSVSLDENSQIRILEG